MLLKLLKAVIILAMMEKNKGGLHVKKALALLLMSLLILSVFCSCSFPHAQPDETETQPEPTSAAEETSAPQDEKPFFRLSALPKIGSYYDGTVYKRMTEDYVDSFQPSDQYGTVVPYIGDYRTYKSAYTEGETDFDGKYPRYGLMTADGAVITDAVYDYAYTDNGLILLSQSGMKDGKESYRQTILPFSGKWVIEADCSYAEGLWTYSSEKDARIALFNYDTGTADVYDYSGKKLFSKRNIELFEGTFDTGLFVMNTKQSGEGAVATLLDKDGKTVAQVKAQVYLYGGNYHYFSAMSEKKKTFSLNEYDTEYSYGVIKRDGSWLIEPKYKRAEVYGDKYFFYDDGSRAVICDEKLKPIARMSSEEADSRIFECFNGEMIYHRMSDSKTAYYSLADDKPITIKGRDLTEIQTVEGTGWFFGIDTDGNGCLFARDGTVKKTFADAERFSGFLKKGLFEIITGSSKKKISHAIDAETLEEVFSYTYFDGTYEVFQYGSGTGSESQRYMAFYRWAEAKEPEQPYLIRDIKTGKVVADHCDYAVSFEVSGKEYYLVLKDNMSTVTDSDGRVLLNMPYSYVD